MTLSHSDLLEIMSALVAPVESAGKVVMKIHASGIAARQYFQGANLDPGSQRIVPIRHCRGDAASR